MFSIVKGKTVTLEFPKTASTPMLVGDAVVDSTGNVAPAVTASTAVLGIVNRKITSSSVKVDGVTADYATTTNVPVIIPTDEVVFLADTVNGSTSIPAIGGKYDLGAYDSSKGTVVDATITSVGQFECVARGAADGSTAYFRIAKKYNA